MSLRQLMGDLELNSIVLAQEKSFGDLLSRQLEMLGERLLRTLTLVTRVWSVGLQVEGQSGCFRVRAK